MKILKRISKLMFVVLPEITVVMGDLMFSPNGKNILAIHKNDEVRVVRVEQT